jgi:hypothetical protein
MATAAARRRKVSPFQRRMAALERRVNRVRAELGLWTRIASASFVAGIIVSHLGS